MESAIPGILIGATAGGVPTAALMPNVYLRPTPGLPVPGTGWSPGTGPNYAAAARRFAGTLAEERRTRPSAADRAEDLLPA